MSMVQNENTCVSEQDFIDWTFTLKMNSFIFKRSSDLLKWFRELFNGCYSTGAYTRAD